jgi:hypothetical protein
VWEERGRKRCCCDDCRKGHDKDPPGEPRDRPVDTCCDDGDHHHHHEHDHDPRERHEEEDDEH